MKLKCMVGGEEEELGKGQLMSFFKNNFLYKT